MSNTRFFLVLGAILTLGMTRSAGAEAVRIELPTGATVPADFVRPSPALAAPAVVLLDGCRARASAVRDWRAALREAGHAVLTPRTTGRPEVDREIAEAAHAWLLRQPAIAYDRIAVVGLSDAGRAALLASTGGRFHAAVGVNPAQPYELGGTVPLLLLVGEESRRASPAALRELAAAAAARGSLVETRVYRALGDGFDCGRGPEVASAPSDRASSRASRRARRDVLEFLALRLPAQERIAAEASDE